MLRTRFRKAGEQQAAFGGQDIAFGQDRTGRLLPWLIAPLVCLAVMAGAGAIMLNRSIDGLTGGVKGAITVHLPTVGVTEADADKAAQRAASILRRQPGIDRVQIMDRARVASLIAPWSGATTEGLPLPRLLTASLRPGAEVRTGALGRVMRSIVPGASVTNHQQFLAGYMGLSRWMSLGGIAIVLFILLLVVLTLAFATRMSLGIHREAVELLSLIGARDQQIALQFGRHAFSQGLLGGALGACMGALVIGCVILAAADGSISATVQIAEQLAPWWLWLMILVSPILAGLLSRVTARTIVMHALPRMT